MTAAAASVAAELIQLGLLLVLAVGVACWLTARGRR